MKIGITPVKGFNLKGLLEFDKDIEEWDEGGRKKRKPSPHNYMFVDTKGNVVEEGFVGIAEGFVVFGETEKIVIERFIKTRNTLKYLNKSNEIH